MYLKSVTGIHLTMTSQQTNNILSSEYPKIDSEVNTLSTQTDETLMKNYSTGYSDAFEELYRRHQSALFRYCIRQFRNASIAEECFQEIWMKLIRSRNRYQSTAKFTTYLYRIAQNHIIDTYRKEQKRRLDCEYEENLSDSSMYQQDNCLSTEYFDSGERSLRINSLREAISELPFEQKNTLLLKMDNGLSIEQIAEITGCKKESVKSRLRYASTKLKQLLSSNDITSKN